MRDPTIIREPRAVHPSWLWLLPAAVLAYYAVAILVATVATEAIR